MVYPEGPLPSIVTTTPRALFRGGGDYVVITPDGKAALNELGTVGKEIYYR